MEFAMPTSGEGAMPRDTPGQPGKIRSLSARQLADHLGVSRQTIARAAASGRLEGWRAIQVNAYKRYIPVTDASAKGAATADVEQ